MTQTNVQISCSSTIAVYSSLKITTAKSVFIYFFVASMFFVCYLVKTGIFIAFVSFANILNILYAYFGCYAHIIFQPLYSPSFFRCLSSYSVTVLEFLTDPFIQSMGVYCSHFTFYASGVFHISWQWHMKYISEIKEVNINNCTMYISLQYNEQTLSLIM